MLLSILMNLSKLGKLLKYENTSENRFIIL